MAASDQRVTWRTYRDKEIVPNNAIAAAAAKQSDEHRMLRPFFFPWPRATADAAPLKTDANFGFATQAITFFVIGYPTVDVSGSGSQTPQVTEADRLSMASPPKVACETPRAFAMCASDDTSRNGQKRRAEE
ncbi:hypothetical protein [Mesorhizobium onobrychidis]|uniref:Uncharacterized protein n=1 Tax=Mesorhizobium onobrychidis TaxID=2775404 RepID=A0ABY5QPZ4_9HYPH|nr:hypothetical protein [Mesorhizobium onobrychidis]UVC13088.1 hypothetical protein IHQ72_20285 [Mesorhizobium onobrychidis]